MIWYIYLALNISFSLLDNLPNKNKKYLSALLLVSISIFLGMRYEVGVDWVVYENLFSGNEINVQFEPGYVLTSMVFSSLGLNFWFFVFVITVSLFLSLNNFFKKTSPLPLFCLGVYYTISFAFNIDFLRQIIAVAISLVAINCYINKKYLMFIFFTFISIMMHASAAIILLLPLINRDVFRNYAILVLSLGIILSLINQYPVEWIIKTLSIFSSSVYVEKIRLYASSTESAQFFTVNLLFKIIIFLTFILNKNKIYSFAEKTKKVDSLKVCVSIFYLMMLVDVYLGKYGTIRLRLDEYLNPAFIITLSYILVSFKKKLSKQIFIVFILVYCISSFIKFTYDPYFTGQFEYHNSLFSTWLDDKDLDLKRREEVNLYWQEREKVIVGD